MQSLLLNDSELRSRLRWGYWTSGVIFLVLLTLFIGLSLDLGQDFDSRWQKVKVGMTANEVRELLDEPTRCTDALKLVGVGDNYWFYDLIQGNSRRIYIVSFRDDRVTKLTVTPAIPVEF